MSQIIVLDTGPLGLVTHARANEQTLAATQWLMRHLGSGTEVAVPEICDYELRRELLRIGSLKSLRRLDELVGAVRYLPLTTVAMRRAAELWARLRREGTPTAPKEALDGDVILCALAQLHSEQTRQELVVATTNVAHLQRMVASKLWSEI
ncbi:MAG TPA: PIN domain-containing protein [Myxococcales bacterium]|nr:PIN domain-containing protein [Myxococcales bacterium]